MAYYLDNPDGGNVRVNFAQITCGLNVGDYFEISLRGYDNADASNRYRIIGQQAAVSSLVEVLTTQISTRLDGGANLAWNFTREPDNTDTIYRFEKVAVDTWEATYQGNSLGTRTSTGNFLFDQIFNIVNNATQAFKGRVYYFKGSTNGGVSDTFNYDPSASGGTGSILPDTVGSNDGTLVNFPTDDSQWVFYSDGGVTGTAAFDITKPTFAVAGSATVPAPTGDIAFDITKPSFSATGAATLPAPIGNIDFAIDSPVFSSTGSATLPQPTGNISYTISAPTFSSTGSATLPNPTGTIAFDISKPLFSGAGSATTPNPIGNASFTIDAPTFAVEGQATLPQPTGDIGFAINAPTFSGQGAAIGFEPIGNIAFDISKPSFSASGSATLPQPVGNVGFTIDRPIFDILGSQTGVVISYAPDAIITVNSGQNIIIVTND